MTSDLPSIGPQPRVPPQNVDAEQALLGAILANNTALDKVQGFLLPEHFYEPVHGRIYQAALTLFAQGRKSDAFTLKHFFESDDTLKEIGGTAYLARLVASATHILNVEDYGRNVFETAQYRALIDLGTNLVNTSFEPSPDSSPKAVMEDTEQAIYALAEATTYGKGFQVFGRALTDAIDMAAAAYQRDGGLSGIATGLRDLDAKLGGLQPSDLIILAGRPAMGKTALATNIAYNIAAAYKADYQPDGSLKVTDGGVVGFFSLEMSSEQLATRIISEQAGISSERIRRGKITPDEFNRLVDVSQELQSLPLYIDATGGLTLAQLAARARRLKRQRGIGLIVVDYLQLLTGSRQKAKDGRVQEVTEITVGLKALAKELNVPIIALSQLSRQVEQRDDKRPQLSDLRESGSIEQDADVVMFVYREEYYLAKKEPRPGTTEYLEWQTLAANAHGKAEVIIGKQRHGPTGTVALQFEAQLTRFSNLAKPEIQEGMFA